MDETEFVAELSESDQIRLLAEAEEVLAIGGEYLRFTSSEGVTMLLRVSRIEPREDGH